jgi:nicotinate-nucleotide adenylyltransferase
MKIGIFGGTFNPPHIGHLITAESVRETIALDRIIFMPSYISPHKQEGEQYSARHRFTMTKIAIASNNRFDISNEEIEKGDTSYTIDTLDHLRKTHDNASLYLIVGMDNYITFHLWKEPKRILEHTTLVVMNRPNYPQIINEIIGTTNVLFVDVPDIDISSSDIRQRMKEGRSVKYLVPDDVERYMIDNNLYK